ncbi:antibiotic biosynthesis protein AlbB [Bacillus smithii]|uniref:antibiotic biosynthesis protein AlbB n=1 Tax=Bacillus smithii TaxID=1479 RepID=UPI002E1B18FF|nr:antibiotic biosynthesis protein AlbB [Bacillus smithii]MED1455788.1 antibiotic biosynthesis protein AlbB [Bacillus smithii]
MSENRQNRGSQRKVFLYIISLIFFAAAITYFVKGDWGFGCFSLIIAIVFVVRATKDVKR